MTRELLVTRNSLLVIYHPAPTTRANYVCAGLRYNFHATGINRGADYGCTFVIAPGGFTLGLDLKYTCVILDPFAVLNITFRRWCWAWFYAYRTGTNKNYSCKDCPVANTGTSMASGMCVGNSTSITACYISKGITGADSSGEYVLEGNCYYSN